MSLGSVVKDWRTRAGWTQGQLALKIGKSKSYLSRLEKDDFDEVGSSVVEALAKAFGKSVEELRAAAGGVEPSKEPVDSEIDDLIFYLHGQKADAKTIRQLKRIAESLLAEEREGKIRGARDFD